MKKILFVISLIIIFSNCSVSQYDYNIKSIDSLIVKYEKLHTSIINMKVTTAEIQYEEYKNLEKESKQTLEEYNIENIKDLKFITDLKKLKRYIKPYMVAHKKLPIKIKKNIEELESLKSDIKNKKYQEKEIKKYLNEERKLFLNQKNNFISLNKNFEECNVLLVNIEKQIQDLKKQ